MSHRQKHKQCLKYAAWGRLVSKQCVAPFGHKGPHVFAPFLSHGDWLALLQLRIHEGRAREAARIGARYR